MQRRCRRPDLPPLQRQIILRTFFEGRKRPRLRHRHRISVSTYDNYLRAAVRTLRASMKEVVDISSDMDRPPWDDRIEHLLERRAATQLRRVSRKKGKRSALEGDGSNFEGERSNFEGDRGKNGRAGAG